MVAGRPDGCLGAVVYAQFVENMNDMAFDSMGADVEHACDIVVAGAFSQNAEKFQFPRRKGHGERPVCFFHIFRVHIRALFKNGLEGSVQSFGNVLLADTTILRTSEKRFTAGRAVIAFTFSPCPFHTPFFVAVFGHFGAP